MELTPATFSAAVVKAIAAKQSREACRLLSVAKAWSPSDLAPLADRLLADDNLVAAVTALLAVPEALESVCGWMFDWYNLEILRPFVLRFLPSVLWIYLSRHLNGEDTSLFETLLLRIYSFEEESHRAAPEHLIAPALACSSVFHSSPAAPTFPKGTTPLAPAPKFEPEIVDVVIPAISRISASNRADLFRVVLMKFSAHVSSLPSSTLRLFSLFALNLVSSEFSDFPLSTVCPQFQFPASTPAVHTSTPSHSSIPRVKRLPVAAPVLMELINSLSFCLSVLSCRPLAAQALQALALRAERDLVPEAALAACSLLELTQANAVPVSSTN
eukprot:GILI01020640.1.p1 GENE.GILI01020640.1~~GILI01020640.1.p1  ORF type:complete len:329 (+),score=91.74 GILI01020640.1:49-1035(+)